MTVIEIRLIEDKYTFITNGRASTTTFDKKFRTMMINKAKFLVKNTSGPLKLIIEDENSKVSFEKEFANSRDVNMSELV